MHTHGVMDTAQLLTEVGINKNEVAMELQKELVRYDVPGHC